MKTDLQKQSDSDKNDAFFCLSREKTNKRHVEQLEHENSI